MSRERTRVRAAEAGQQEQWDAFVLAHPRASFFHLSPWARVVERVFGHAPAPLCAWRGAELVGVLPLMRTRSLRGRLNLISMPYAVYGGPLGLDGEAEQALVEGAVELADRAQVGHLELRYEHDPGPDLVSNPLYWTFQKDLPATPAEVLARMPKKARAEARKARERNELELSEGVWYVEDLYRLFLESKQKLGSPGLPAEFFRELVAELGSKVSVHLVRRERAPLAAVMSFHFRDTLLAYYSGTAEGADRKWSASNFMYASLQEWAVARGFKKFDFGRSRRGSGAFAFKEHQGFEPRPLHYRYHLARDRRLPNFTPSNPRTAVLRRIWTHLPAWLVRRASDRLARHLP